MGQGSEAERVHLPSNMTRLSRTRTTAELFVSTKRALPAPHVAAWEMHARGPCAVSKPQRQVPQVRQRARESGWVPQSAQGRCEYSWKSCSKELGSLRRPTGDGGAHGKH